MALFTSLVFVSFLIHCAFSQTCKCIPYYLCNTNNGKIITDGTGVLEERFGGGGNCTGENVCCDLPSTSTLRSFKPARCGIQNPDILKTNNGNSESNTTLFGEFPWMVAIFVDDTYRCGGSLIHPSVILTAAHCARDNKTYTARAGEWDTNSTNEESLHQDRSVSTIKMHEAYTHGNKFNDVALLFLDSPFELNWYINIVCLPQPEAVIATGSCYASGWGKANYGSMKQNQSLLKKVLLPIVPRSKCQEDLRNTRLGEYFNLDRSFMCAGGEKGKDTCIGDGGGPLVCKSDTDSYQQAGIVSWGIGCSDQDVPGVYADVAYARSWIDRQLGERNIKI